MRVYARHDVVQYAIQKCTLAHTISISFQLNLRKKKLQNEIDLHIINETVYKHNGPGISFSQ